MNLTNEERFNLGVARTRWKSDKTLHAEEWFKADSASRYMEGRTYDVQVLSEEKEDERLG